MGKNNLTTQERIGLGKATGETNKKKGKAFFQEIGRKGGNTTRDKYGPEFFSQIGKKGGKALAAERGVEFFSTIGRLGGNKNK